VDRSVSDLGGPVHKLGLDGLTADSNEPLDRLEKNRQAEREKKNTIEECAKELGACPTEGEVLGRLGSLRDLKECVAVFSLQ
jgi:hypothetical protein